MKKLIYIAHPIGSDPKGNLMKIGEIYRTLSLQNEVIPFAPYLTAMSCLNDLDPAERAIGMSHNAILFQRKVFDELWVYGDHISKGVAEEIKMAEAFGIPVRMM